MQTSEKIFKVLLLYSFTVVSFSFHSGAFSGGGGRGKAPPRSLGANAPPPNFQKGNEKKENKSEGKGKRRKEGGGGKQKLLSPFYNLEISIFLLERTKKM